MTAPAVSVIIALFNSEPWLRQCLDSVVSQTLHNIEVLIIDDASTDSSGRIADEYAARDSRITVHHLNKNGGSGEARNIGIGLAQGDYIAFLDSDDFYYSSEALQRLYDAAVTHKAAVSAGSLLTVNNDGIEICRTIGKQYFPREGWVAFSQYQFCGGFYRFLFSRQFIQQSQLFFPSYMRYQDPPFLAKVLDAAERFYALPDYVYAYRKNHKTVHWNNALIQDCIQGMRDVFDIACNNGYAALQLRVRNAVLRIIGRHMILLRFDMECLRWLRCTLHAFGTLPVLTSPLVKMRNRITNGSAYGR